MKTIALLLIPSITLLVSACAPAGPTYVSGGGYVGGGGPGDGSGYYGPGGVWVVETGYSRDHDYGYYHHDDNQYNRSVTNVNDVNVNRTVENDRTVNRTNVNQTNLSRKNVKESSKNMSHRNKPADHAQNGQGNPQDQYHQ